MPTQGFLLVFVTALGLTLLLTPAAVRIAARYGFVDVPGKPKHVHQRPTPRLGGPALYVAFVMAIAVSLLFPRTDPREFIRLAGVIVGATFMFLLGVYDDRWELPAIPQIGAMVVAAAIAVAFDMVIREVNSPLGGPIALGLLAVPFTLFWLVGMMVTVNWLDGLDGLAAGVTFIASAILFVHTAFRQVPPQPSIALLPAALAGCTLGFLPFNFHPARVFLGSSGAYFLGFALGTLAIIGGAKMATTLLVLGVPILDVAWRIISRVHQGRAPWLSDREHLHHRLYDMGLSQRRVVLVYYALCGAFGLLALVLPLPIYKLYALIAMGLIAVGVLWMAARHSRRLP